VKTFNKPLHFRYTSGDRIARGDPVVHGNPAAKI
jgi:hypothetical protein